ncbi:hypothetical protein HUO13_22310 [Saccharopolyspora erythraea]|uniref:hypothetical protein n=1 Tax=Saccharopolyspora erythraea TaxID=1836 RepID=UPI001BAC1EC6|nr:hypothetical protein [Saccharopolyspora erythraea]QUH03194.1 hypothetical protein HUO13_22310 [Saccharopolyspora erythraea]
MSEHVMEHIRAPHEIARPHDIAFPPGDSLSPADKRERAARTLAQHAGSSEELSEWLDMLGLSAFEGLAGAASGARHA